MKKKTLTEPNIIWPNLTETNIFLRQIVQWSAYVPYTHHRINSSTETYYPTILIQKPIKDGAHEVHYINQDCSILMPVFLNSFEWIGWIKFWEVETPYSLQRV